MNGFDWKVQATCATCGASEQAIGPAEFVGHKREAFLSEHNRHEYTVIQSLERPSDLDEAVRLPEFMRTVEVT